MRFWLLIRVAVYSFGQRLVGNNTDAKAHVTLKRLRHNNPLQVDSDIIARLKDKVNKDELLAINTIIRANSAELEQVLTSLDRRAPLSGWGVCAMALIKHTKLIPRNSVRIPECSTSKTCRQFSK